VVVARGAAVRSIHVAVRVDDDPLIVYWADGVIVATATGSTAYGFSVGGPLILPSSRAIMLVPIAPHLSFGNAVVFDPEQRIELGSGLGALADDVKAADRIAYETIPGWHRSTAPGHAGELVVGTLEGKPVAVMKGRLHYYEGYDIQDVAFPVRVFNAWGIDTIILTNACGGLNPSFENGDLMVVSDHINFMGTNPLRGPNDDALGPRFPDM